MDSEVTPPMSLYIRIRGKVRGPFAMDKLRELAQRGQLSRIHEVSADAVAWQKASEFPELFRARNATTEPEKPVAIPMGTNSKGSGSPKPEPVGAEAEWYFAEGDQHKGPYKLDDVRRLVLGGHLTASDMVWRDGLPDWATVSAVPELAACLPRVNQGRRGSSHDLDGRLELDTIRTLTAPRGWLLFIIIWCFLYTAIAGVTGVLLIMGGSRAEAFPFIAWGLMSFIYAAVLLVVGLLLLAYYRAISQAASTGSEQSLEFALRRLSMFWTFGGVVLVVLLIQTIGAGIWLFSIFSSLAGEITP